jgi:NhaP-type Na+/H+ or K+/H+ antiporter/Trk K+ transport system NAD-binding subunit
MTTRRDAVATMAWKMSTDDVLLGLGLVTVLAVGSQLLAGRLRLPAIVVLLPVGFLAGIATDDVHPDALLGALYQPFVSLAVGVILFEAGLRLSVGEVARDIRKIVGRLVSLGVLVTWAGVTVAVALLFDGLGDLVPLLIGAVLVVSGPTVVLPLLSFVRPAGKVRSLLMWEGVLVDPVGALLGVLVFHAVLSGGSGGQRWRPGEMLLSVGVGALVGAVAAAILWVLLRETQRTAPRQAVPAVLMMVVAALVGADLIREDAGFVATTLMGAVLANQRRIDVSLMLEFHGTLVQLLIGALFVLIAASVSPSDVNAVLPGALVLVAAMVVVIRPLAVALATWRSGLTLRERAFVAWMAPRGIVAGATASAFGLELAQAKVPGAEHILPIVFVAIFGTVVLYGLTAAPVARLLGVAETTGRVVLVVGGSPWARAIAQALKARGLGVRLWSGRADDQAAARAVGLQADRGRMMLDAMSREAELEDVTDALLLTANDDFNALAAVALRTELGHGRVYRVAPDIDEMDLLAPPDEPGILGADSLTSAELRQRFANGARLVEASVDGRSPRAGRSDGELALFVVSAGGALQVVTEREEPRTRAGDTVIVLADEE